METMDKFHESTRIDDIKIVRKSFNLPLHKVHNAKNFHFEINIKDSVNNDEKDSKVFYIIKNIGIKILAKVAETETEFAEFEMVYTFSFNNENDFISMSGNSIILNEELAEWLDNVVLSTTRGAMYSELRGSYIDEVIFPLIKPKDLKI